MCPTPQHRAEGAWCQPCCVTPGHCPATSPIPVESTCCLPAPAASQQCLRGLFFAFPCSPRAGEGYAEHSLAAGALPGELPLPPLPGAAQESPARLLPCSALRRPLILPPLMLISEVVHGSSLICYPGGVSFRGSEREPGGSGRVPRALREPQRQQPVLSRCQGRQIPADPAPTHRSCQDPRPLLHRIPP